MSGRLLTVVEAFSKGWLTRDPLRHLDRLEHVDAALTSPSYFFHVSSLRTSQGSPPGAWIKVNLLDPYPCTYLEDCIWVEATQGSPVLQILRTSAVGLQVLDISGLFEMVLLKLKESNPVQTAVASPQGKTYCIQYASIGRATT